MSNTALLCPVCASGDLNFIHDTTTSTYRVACKTCGLQAGPSESQGDALLNWNRRVALPGTGIRERAAIAAMQAMVERHSLISKDPDNIPKSISRKAVEIADELLHALSQPRRDLQTPELSGSEMQIELAIREMAKQGHDLSNLLVNYAESIGGSIITAIHHKAEDSEVEGLREFCEYQLNKCINGPKS